jgi:1-acyl-sn-glycerol-3-phosphate acyltransferase
VRTGRREDDPYWNWVWTIGAPLVGAIVRMLFRLRVEGIEHLPRRGPAILAPNHLSVLDGPIVSAITGAGRRRAVRNLVAAEAFRGPVGWIMREAGQIPLRRGSGDTQALDEATHAVSQGGCAGIFPEGRVSDDAADGPQRIRSGLTRIAMPTGAPVIPVGIWGTNAVWPRTGIVRAALVRRPALAIVYGPPLVPGDGSPSEFRERYREALEIQVAQARRLAGDAG